ncbi:hypothetical protein ED21_27778 [Erythrobacter sp. SD-21]|nr:hypothetical protein ED21_27778 [Erythrobacter sp. SD-21]
MQRPYNWESDHLQEFWSDVVDSIGDSYFIGSMVVYTKGRGSLAVVDGQQRITTITILLCAIREAYKMLEAPQLADGIQSYVEQRDRDNEIVYVLETETSYPYLQEEVLKSDPSEIDCQIGREEERIEQAFRLFRRNITDKLAEFISNVEQTPEQNNEDSIAWLSKLRDTILDLNLILVQLDDEDDAYLIFETLNTRGKDLELFDLLRNHFTKYLKPTGVTDPPIHKLREIHETIESAPMELDVDQFIVHSWQSRYDFVTKAKTFQKAKVAIKESNARPHLNRLLSDAGQWRSIFDIEYQWHSKKEKDVIRSLSALHIFKVVQPTPGLLSLIRSYRDGHIKYRTLRDAIRDIEYFHFSFNAVTSSRSSGGISGMYASLGQNIFRAQSDSAKIGRLIAEHREKLRFREVPAVEFDAGFEQIFYTKTKSAKKALVRYILLKLAKHEGHQFQGETDDLTIEHLVPQAAIGAGYSEEEVGQLGNLILIDSETNGMLSSNRFADKKRILESRGYRLPEQLAGAEELTPKLLRSNTLRLAEIAREQVWKV